MEENKVTLNDLKSVNEPVVDERFKNAEAYKQRKLKEYEEENRIREQEKQEAFERSEKERIERVNKGLESPGNQQEMYNAIYNNVMNTMERKKIEKQIIDDYYEEKEAQEKENEEINNIMNAKISDDLDIAHPTKDIKEALDEDGDIDIDDMISDGELEDLDDYIEEDDDIEEDEEDVIEEKGLDVLTYTDKERADIIAKKAKEKIKPIADDKVIDLSQFSVSEKKISVTKVTKITNSEPNLSNWGLFNTGIPIVLEEFKGQELATFAELLASDDDSLTTYNRNRQLYRMIYDHDKSESKPSSFVEWLKQISIRDNDNLYMAVYRASYGGANYVPYNCEKCGEIFVSDSLPLHEMNKFKTKEDEQKAYDILNMIEREPIQLPMARYQISENYVMDFRDPSLYNIMIECAVLDDDYVRNNRDLISYISYIENIYFINRDTMKLEPIDLVKYDKNLKKEIASKIKRYKSILKELSEDQLNSITSHINDIIDLKNVDVEYIIPEAVCPRCGEKIKYEIAGAQNLVFTRHQLALLATI